MFEHVQYVPAFNHAVRVFSFHHLMYLNISKKFLIQIRETKSKYIDK